MLPRSKDAEASSRPISTQPSARISVLIAQLFNSWPSRRFLQKAGRIAGSDSSRLLRLLKEMVGCGTSYDSDFTDPFLAVLEQDLR
jgi:hypothetical protein